MDRSKLIAAFQDTLRMSLSPALKDSTDRAVQSSRVYPEKYHSAKTQRRYSGEIMVEENTTFAAARRYCAGGKTAVLNFANPFTPGGGVQGGAMAQEECLCRSSNLYACLTYAPFQDYYEYHRDLHSHFFSDRLIYTEGVTVFKDDCDIPVLLPKQEWFQVDVITCSAPYIAKRRYTNKAALKALFKSRIRNIFEVAIEHKIDILILGAFGCGAFKNPPEVVAKAFKEVIDENQYICQFIKIVFAIKSTVKNNPFEACPNLMAFEMEFVGISEELNKLRFSDPWPFEQAFGSVEMPTGKILKGGNQFNPYREWQSKNKYFGKQFSILGDSISTLEGYNPEGYNLFYTSEACERSGVKDMKDTWWGKVIDYVGGELLVNNSWSGSRVTKLPGRDTLFPSGCSDERTGGLHIGSVMPDVILVYLGTNDWANGVSSKINAAPLTDGKDSERFDYAYQNMVGKICSNYPNAEIWCCTLNATFMPSEPAFSFPHRFAGKHIEEYNDAIRAICQKKVRLIDLYSYNLPYASVDGSHPTADGMRTIASLILHSLCDSEGVSFLECDSSEHEFVTAEEFTGGTKYVCRKCGHVACSDTLPSPTLYNEYAGSRVDGVQISKTERHIIQLDSEYPEASSNPDIIDYDPDCTSLLYSPEMGIRLHSLKDERELKIFKTEFEAGRGQDCVLRLTDRDISQNHATFMLYQHYWLLCDNGSKNGTWLNETKLIPGKKYVLHPDDVISFANAEKYVFYKTSQYQQKNEDNKSIAFLEAGMKAFYDSEQKDETAFKLAIAALIHAPLFLPVIIDLEAMLGGADPTKLKEGDVLQPSKDVRIAVQTIHVNDAEYVPLFTSTEEVNKGPSTSVMRMYPQDYLPRIMQMGNDAAINPFGGKAFIYSHKMMQELVWPFVQQNMRKDNEEQANRTEDDLVGRIVADKYHLISMLGRSAFFCVMLAVDNANKRYSVKAFDKSWPRMNDSLRNQLMQEAHLMMKFSHPGIPKVFDIIEDEKHLFVVREYIEGETLAQLITKNHSLSAEKTISLGIELAGVLQYLHTFAPAYIYRDMKPANVVVTPSGDVKLIDFGTMTQYNPNATEVTLFGTRGYAAPEQYVGKRWMLDRRTDIYSLGVTLHQCVTGKRPDLPPYEVLPICEVNPMLPKGLEYIICKCTKHDPNIRYQTCEELMRDLQNYQNLPPKKSWLSRLFHHKRD